MRFHRQSSAVSPTAGSHANYVCRRTSAAVRRTGRVQSSVNALSLVKRERAHAMQLQRPTQVAQENYCCCQHKPLNEGNKVGLEARKCAHNVNKTGQLNETEMRNVITKHELQLHQKNMLKAQSCRTLTITID